MIFLAVILALFILTVATTVAVHYMNRSDDRIHVYTMVGGKSVYIGTEE